MAESTWATPQDIRDRWLANDPLPEDTAIQAWLNDAETLILAEFPHLADKLTDDPDGTWRRKVTYVEIALVSQALRNPDGVRQRSQTAGVFTDSVTYGAETIRGVMQLTPAHRAMLADTTTRHSGIDMTPKRPAAHPLHGAWVNGPAGWAPGEGR